MNGWRARREVVGVAANGSGSSRRSPAGRPGRRRCRPSFELQAQTRSYHSRSRDGSGDLKNRPPRPSTLPRAAGAIRPAPRIGRSLLGQPWTNFDPLPCARCASPSLRALRRRRGARVLRWRGRHRGRAGRAAGRAGRPARPPLVPPGSVAQRAVGTAEGRARSCTRWRTSSSTQSGWRWTTSGASPAARRVLPRLAAGGGRGDASLRAAAPAAARCWPRLRRLPGP